jgi:hypothetical protein
MSRSRGQDFIPDDPKPDHLRAMTVFKVTRHGLADIAPQLVERFGLGEDRGTDGASCWAACGPLGTPARTVRAPPEARQWPSLQPDFGRAD